MLEFLEPQNSDQTFDIHDNDVRSSQLAYAVRSFLPLWVDREIRVLDEAGELAE
jgi:hypothetical protein